MKWKNQDLKTIHDKSRSRKFSQSSKNWGGPYKDPEESESQWQKQAILQPMEKVLTGVRGPFKIYGIIIPDLEKYLEKFQGENISLKICNRRKITKDKAILDIIQHGWKLRVIDKPVRDASFEHPRSIVEKAIIDGEIQKLLRKQVICWRNS